MQEIICDTMIWYGLANKSLQHPDPKKYKLVCTYVTFVELALTPNILRKLPDVQNALKAIFDNQPKLILEFPIAHYRRALKKEIQQPFKPDEDLIFGFIRIIYNSKNIEQLKNSPNFKDLLWAITARRLGKDDYSIFKNNLKSILQDAKTAYKKYYDKDLNKEEFRKNFLYELNETQLIKIPATEVDWALIEFYEKVRMNYMRKYRVSFQKHKANDKPDLDNMLYVRPGQKYWTLEKTWLNIFKEEKLEEYVYQNKGIEYLKEIGEW